MTRQEETFHLDSHRGVFLTTGCDFPQDPAVFHIRQLAFQDLGSRATMGLGMACTSAFEAHGHRDSHLVANSRAYDGHCLGDWPRDAPGTPVPLQIRIL